MSLLEDVLQRDLIAMAGDTDLLGASAVYTPSGGSPVSISCVLGPEQGSQELDDGDEMQTLRRQALISMDAASDIGGVASPAIRSATFAVDGKTYAIESMTSQSGMALLELKRKVQIAAAGFEFKKSR